MKAKKSNENKNKFDRSYVVGRNVVYGGICTTAAYEHEQIDIKRKISQHGIVCCTRYHVIHIQTIQQQQQQQQQS